MREGKVPQIYLKDLSIIDMSKVLGYGRIFTNLNFFFPKFLPFCFC